MALGLVYVVSCLNMKRLLSKTSLSTLQGIIVIYINNGVYLLFQLFDFFFKLFCFSISPIFPELCKSLSLSSVFFLLPHINQIYVFSLSVHLMKAP